jgi:uracil-DNA glycosylase family 4
MAEQSELVAALRGYLEDLQESGVEGLPLLAIPPASAPPTAVPAPRPEISASRETLAAVRADLGECQRCALGAGRTTLVFGNGNPHARLLFVGEAPGQEEGRQGEPFVGEAGQLLTKIIAAMGFQRDDVYLCTLLKCHPPENRNPHAAEIEQCQPFLLRQIQAVGPEVVVALGTCAAQALLQTKEPISQLRGQFHDLHGIPLMPTFHPAFLLRSPAHKGEVWADMKQVMARLGKVVPQKQS